MERQEAEKPIENKDSLRPAASKHSDEIIDAVDRMSIEDLQKPDAGLKLLIAQYKEKCDENRILQDKISGLGIRNSDLSIKIAVAKERLKQIGGTGVIIGLLNIIAGAILAFTSALPESWIKKMLYWLAIAIFLVCVLYYFLNRNQKKGLGQKEEVE